MKTLKVVLSLGLVISTNAWSGPKQKINLDGLSCLSEDGIPQAAKCCNAPPADEAARRALAEQCLSGFGSMGDNLIEGMAGSLSLAKTAQNTADQLNGGNADLADHSKDSGSTGSGSGADTQAIGSKAGDYPSSTGGAAGGAGYLASVGKGSGGSGSGSGAGAGSGDGGGMGLGSAGSTGVKGKKSGSEDALTDKYNIGGYTHGEAAAGGKAGDPTKVSLDGFGEQNIGGNGNGAGGAGSGLANGDEDGSGSPNDPSDYFSRLNKSDNLFKIVSKRYVQKKSLWSPQSAVTSGIVPVIKR